MDIVDRNGNLLPDDTVGEMVFYPRSAPHLRYPTGENGKLLKDLCACGSKAPRLLELAPGMTENGDLLATKKVQGDGSEQNDLLEELKLMANDKDRMSYRGSSAGEFLERILSDVALNSSNAQTFNTNYKNITTSVENQRISISGVDEDEEAVNLVKYQNAYTLSSKMIQTLTEVYDRLILYTGV